MCVANCVGEVDNILPLYRKVSVPIYSHPTPSELMMIRQRLVEQCGGVKKAKSLLRSNYRCFISENAIWQVRVHKIRVNGYIEPPVAVQPTLINAMVRTSVPVGKVVEALKNIGVPVNPYSSPLDATNACIGFYARTFEQLEQIVDRLGTAGLITDAMVVNAVWYMKLGKYVDLYSLVNTGIFVHTSSKFKSVTGTIDDSKITIFNTGTIRIMRAPRPDIARLIAGKVYYLLVSSNSIL